VLVALLLLILIRLFISDFKDMKTMIKRILFSIIILMLLLPLIQVTYLFIKLEPLGGSYVPAEKPVFSWDAWFSDNYQEKFNKYIEEHIGFREFFIRLNNQLDFNIFKIAHAEGVVVGKKNYMFEEDYLLEYNGELFIGKIPIERKVRQIKFLQDYLKKTYNIDLIPVFEPGKASFFPEYIPDKYHPNLNKITNYKYYIECFDRYNVKYIDMNAWFKSIKNTSKYSLFPQYGIHWSSYGAMLAMDSLAKYIEKTRNIDLPDISITKINYTNKLQGVDYDMGKAMNLLFKMPTYKMAYPKISFINDKTKTKPSVLVIGDSFYFSLLGEGKISNLFKDDHQLWYYGSKVFPDSYTKETFAEQLDLKKEIEKRDVIFMMCTERFLHTAFWNFNEHLYKLYFPNYLKDTINDIENGIRRYDDWYKLLIKAAKEKNISTEDWVRINAEFVFNEGFSKNTNQKYQDSVLLEVIKIRNEKILMRNLFKTATKEHSFIDDIVFREASKRYNEK